MMKWLLYLAVIFNLAACGGGSSGGSSENEDQLLSNGQQTINEEYAFNAKIQPGRLAEVEGIAIQAEPGARLRSHYLIASRDALADFLSVDTSMASHPFESLDSYAYFLISRSQCDRTSTFAQSEALSDKVTINIKREITSAGADCSTSGSVAFHVFKAKKLHAPETLFETIVYTAQAGGGTAGQYVIDDESAWQAMWNDHTRYWLSTPAMPSVDFSAYTVLSLYRGAASNGCHGITVDRIYRSSGKLIVEYAELVPGPSSVCTAAFVYPWQVIVIPKTAEPIEFVAAVRQRS